ncbi:putative leucine-rich repeat receptor-like protein kinase [Planoprotostelium fungivorum]|uniref:non-specific serine/threonine protein kinase n=1 Tax=Planoprotostelium fungivorum TaxID=1890364 RepID=A0A2P6NP57_9EUKA|nr:putative leucine-rich repeat receptor-like protein kinase [Planoprotostelium fungivorum]
MNENRWCDRVFNDSGLSDEPHNLCCMTTTDFLREDTYNMFACPSTIGEILSFVVHHGTLITQRDVNSVRQTLDQPISLNTIGQGPYYHNRLDMSCQSRERTLNSLKCVCAQIFSCEELELCQESRQRTMECDTTPVFCKIRVEEKQKDMHCTVFFCLLISSIVVADQLSALNSFYDQLGDCGLTELGAKWYNQTGWKGTDACNFYGITCDVGGNVIAINLTYNHLSGIFPSNIWADLSSLEYLLLPYNFISSQIPSSLSNCTHLVAIDLTYNLLYGDIGNFGLLPNLRTLTLYHNRFSSISSSFCSLINLQSLDLGTNQINSIPSCFGQLTNLTMLFLENNAINSSVPSSFSNLVHLQSLRMRSNQIVGPLTFLCSLKNLTSIDISYNKFDSFPGCNYTGMALQLFYAVSAGTMGEIPITMGDLRLVAFQVSRSSVSGRVPSGIFNPYLQILDLAYNFLEGPLSDRLTSCTRLTSIDISYNHFTSMPNDFSRFVYLQTFVADLNSIQSPFPNITNCRRIQKFSAIANRFHGELPQNLSALTQLTSFSICQYTSSIIYREFNSHTVANDVEGMIPSDLGLLPLETLNLGDNRLTGQIPSSFVNLTELNTLVLSDNSLSGDIPPWVFNLPSLTSLDLSFNSFSGLIPLPPSFVTLDSLDLSKNKLSGTISQELSDRYAVNQLNLEYNQLSGTLPYFYYDMEQLKLGGNAFSGEIPASIGNSTQLTLLDLSDNQFHGQLPDVFDQLHTLEIFIVSGNNLSGPIPSFGCLYMTTLKMDVNSFSGTIPYVLNYMLCAYVLTTVDLSWNQLSGDTSNLSGLYGVKTLMLGNNYFTGEVSWLPNCQDVKQLDLSNNQFTGDIFDDQSISHLNGALVYLDISGNAFTGKILFQLPTALVYFDASYNQFVDSYLPGKAVAGYGQQYPTMVTCNIGYNKLRGYLLTLFTRDNFPFLSELDLSGNELIGPIPPTLGQLTQLTSLLLEGNQLSSEIPRSLGNLAELIQLNLGSNGLYTDDLSFLFRLNQLQLLNLSNNKIQASIPNNIDHLVRLETFDVSHNRMYGQIPLSMYKMRVLTKLYVNDNNMTGQVSAFSADLSEIDLRWEAVIDGLVSVTYLNLSHNSFSGALPDISQKLKLQTIDVSYNRISGSIPSLSALSKLEMLQMRSNELNGSLPSLSRLSSLSFFDVSDNRLSDNMGIASLPSSLQQCNMSSNEFECPVTYESISSCQAECTTSKNDSAVIVQIRVEGQVSTFNQSLFLLSLSAASNTSLSRLSIVSVTSGSVIANVQISAAEEGSTDGTAMRRAAIISSLVQPGEHIGTFDVLSPAIINPPPTSVPIVNPPTSNGNNNTGLIIGVVVGVACLIIIAVIVAGFVYARSRRTKSVWQNQLAMLDLKSINLGEAKSSITPFSELKDMREIGSGAFGIVYRAEWRSIDVAVKQIRAEHVTQTQLADFMGEVALLQRLRPHPNVVLFMAVTFPPDPLSLGVLRGWIHVAWVHGIALGMYHLHQEKVIHRDLAARNILLSKFLEAKVSDFGLSRETQTVDTAAQTQTNVGPLKWMAPEAMRDRIYSQATDVFSFGVTVWEILTEQDPWTDLTPMEAALKVITDKERMKIPDGIKFWIDKLIRDCWEEEPSRRPLFPQICERIANTTKVEEYEATAEEVTTAVDAAARYDSTDNISPNQDAYTKVERASVIQAEEKIILQLIFQQFDRKCGCVAHICGLLGVDTQRAKTQTTSSSLTIEQLLSAEGTIVCLDPQNSTDQIRSMYRMVCFTFFVLLLSSTVVADQLSALQSFYDQLDGNEWYRQAGWNGTDFCNFHGITCDDAGNVTTIDLTSNRLFGPFPSDVWADLPWLKYLLLPGNYIYDVISPSLSDATNLISIDFTYNYISGDIGDLGRLPNLQFLRLYGNYFSSISSSFCSLTTLESLDLGFNSIEGTIPSCIGQFTNLTVLLLNNNKFTSTIPSSLSNLVQLTRFQLDANQLSGPMIEICGLKNLTFIDISGNSFTILPDCNYTGMIINTIYFKDTGLSGEIPSSMGDLPLVIFQVRGNKFSGQVPAGIFSPIITLIDLSYNTLSGPIPDGFTNCSQLMYMDISFNHFTAMPSDFSRLVKLYSFVTDLNGIESEFPNIENCTQLYKFSVTANRLYGILPNDFSAFTQLNTFSIFANDVEGEIPSGFSSSLQTLNLGDNRLTGQISQSFINLTQLQTLVLSDNALSGDIPSWLIELYSITSLDLSFNSFSGPIPLPSSVVSLDTLDLELKERQSKNKLSGTISQELSDRYAVTQLNLEFNLLNGTLPSFYTGMQQLKLGGNSFSGELPASISNNTAMKLLDLSNNQLSGQLPDVFESMTSLQTFIISGNNFSGAIPHSLTYPPMVTMKMDDNSFSGLIPKDMQYLNRLTTLDLSSNQLSGDTWTLNDLSNLETILLGNNNLTGTVTWLFSCANLHRLDLSNNQFTGDIFDDQGISPNQKALIYLDISRNAFTGKILFQLPPSLVYFDASYNQFVDSYVPSKALAGFGQQYPTMVTCNIGYNKLRGYLLTLFTRDNFPFLSELDLSGNELIGPIPPTLGQLTQLRSLLLEGNKLSSEIPKSLGNLVQLTQLNLGSNGLYTDDLSFLFRLSQLQMLNLSNNEIRASIPDNIDSLSRLESFDVSHNRMYGQIPVSMYKIRVLTKLYVNDNNMTGNVSAFSADLSEIDLSSNGFYGAAAVIDGLVSVTYLNLSHNSFSGALPDISQKLKLQTIDVSYNHISGSISSLSALSKLEMLQMRSNELNGSLPSLSRLSSLSFFDVSDNHLNDNTAVRSLPSSLQRCNMSSNVFECPVTSESISLCQAECTTSKNDSAVVVQIRVEGQVSTFNQSLFLLSLSDASNTSLSRLSIVSITSGSVIANVQISVAEEGSTDGTAMRRAAIISSLAQTGNSIGSFSVLSPAVINPPPPTTADQIVNAPTSSDGNSNTGLIIGVVVGVACLIIIAVVIAGFVYARSRRTRSVWQNQLAMIDLKSINLGEAKSSITPFSELKGMTEIGSGAFGIVYRAEWRSLDVAVKQIRAEHVTQTQLTDFMVYDSLFHSSLTIHREKWRCYRDSDLILMAVTFPPDPLSLRVLRGWLYVECVSFNVVTRVTKSAALGMYHLHQEKVIHRDLAARNILLSKFLEAKVSDFGLSRETQTVDTAAQTQNSVGPLKWMAPEAMRDRIYSQATDVFSFGVTVWEILTEQDPWTDLTPMEAALKVITDKERMKIPDGIEYWIDKLIRDCWEEEPSRRPLFPQICERITNTTKVEEFETTAEEVTAAVDAAARYDSTDNISHNENTYAKVERASVIQAEEKIEREGQYSPVSVKR